MVLSLMQKIANKRFPQVALKRERSRKVLSRTLTRE